MLYWFTADEHYNHANIIKYCNRPFSSVEEMNNELITRHNSVVNKRDIVVHAGDFTLERNLEIIKNIINQLKGKHIFLKGSHDTWLNQSNSIQILEKKLENFYIIVCHYPMLIWSKSHYNSWNLFGHIHSNKLRNNSWDLGGKQYDIGVDNNDYYPISFEQLKIIMSKLPNNKNLIK